MLRTLPLFLAAATLGLTAAASTPEAPSLKPPRAFQSTVTDANHAKILHDALKAAENRQWSTLAALQNRASDPAVADAILWLRASKGVPGMEFEELAYALDHLSDWPSTSDMQKRAESLIGDSRLSPAARVEWLNKVTPRTGAGKVALANALLTTGKTDEANSWARNAWRNSSLSRDLESGVKSRFKSTLTQDDHRARADFLLWTNQRSAANRIRPLLTADYRALVDARIALASRRRGVDKYVTAVPQSLQNDPGLLFERAKWRRKRGNKSGATPLLVGIDGNDVPLAGRSKLWKERNINLREDLKTGNWTRAYQLAAPHGMSSGGSFADAEWISGWIALRLNNDAARGLQHFEKMKTGVSTPISLARGDYWAGRAHDVLGHNDETIAAYSAAAEHKFTYYGQLAAENLSDTQLSFDAPVAPTDTEAAAFEARRVVKALRLFGESGETRLFRKFAYHLDDQLTTPAEFELLAGIANEFMIQDIGVRGAKSGLGRGIVAPNAAYPIVDYPLLREPRVERSLMLALSRQESEMNPNAYSHAGAMGIMQFMPATARLEARKRGLPYRKSWLRDDPGYNMTLGGQHLDTLLDQFNGSYIMAAAAYNAGPSRPNKWIKDYGDPRTGAIDPIDWVEFIPFSETRNYVQRVLENTQVYRTRLSGQPEQITLSKDLKRGS
jgi:soluble lytic murein transglycosylase